MKHFESIVQSNTEICEDCQELTFCWNRLAGIPRPGQFLTIRVADTTAPLLRRPFAFSGLHEAEMQASIIYQKRGSATQILAGKRQGDLLDVIGPLGNGFSLPGADSRPLLVAGGIGLGPILFLSQTIASAGGKYRLVFGCRTASQVPGNEAFSRAAPVVCTDDGSTGFRGTVVDYLRTLAQEDLASAHLYVCGPAPMLRACHGFAVEHDLPCSVSIEQTMACGIGACMGCAVKITKEPGYARACTEGPVFESRTIRWDS